MRIPPEKAQIIREAQVDDDMGGVRVKQGELIAIYPWLVHRHRTLWADPDKLPRAIATRRPWAHAGRTALVAIELRVAQGAEIRERLRGLTLYFAAMGVSLFAVVVTLLIVVS